MALVVWGAGCDHFWWLVCHDLRLVVCGADCNNNTEDKLGEETRKEVKQETASSAESIRTSQVIKGSSNNLRAKRMQRIKELKSFSL